MPPIFTPLQLATLQAILNRIIPKDDFPNATEANVDQYVLQILNLEMAPKLPLITAGLDSANSQSQSQHQKPFPILPPDSQDTLLHSLESQEWFSTLTALAMEGFYADPGNGGNKNEVSWKMIGYEPGAARHA